MRHRNRKAARPGDAEAAVGSVHSRRASGRPVAAVTYAAWSLAATDSPVLIGPCCTSTYLVLSANYGLTDQYMFE